MITFNEMQEKLQQKETHSTVMKMVECLTADEQIRISFVPLIIIHCAWEYATKALDLAAQYRMSEFKKLSRSLREAKAVYLKNLEKDLKPHQIAKIESETNRCIQSIGYDLSILYFTVNSEIKRSSPDIAHEDMRTMAVIAILFICYLKIYNHKIDDLLAEKMLNDNLQPTVTPKLVDALFAGMVVMSGVEGKFDFKNKQVQLAMDVIDVEIKKIQFNLID